MCKTKQKTSEGIFTQTKADLTPSMFFSSTRRLQFCLVNLEGKYSSTGRNLSHDKFSQTTPKTAAQKVNSNRRTANRHAGESQRADSNPNPGTEGESASATRLAPPVPLGVDRRAFRVENHRGFACKQMAQKKNLQVSPSNVGVGMGG